MLQCQHRWIQVIIREETANQRPDLGPTSQSAVSNPHRHGSRAQGTKSQCKGSCR